MSYGEFARLTASPLDRAVDRAIAEVNSPGYDPAQNTFLQSVLRDLGNEVAQEGCDRCFCGCKYWENDKCIDCGTDIGDVRLAQQQEEA